MIRYWGLSMYLGKGSNLRLLMGAKNYVWLMVTTQVVVCWPGILFGAPRRVGCSKQTSKAYTFFAYSFTSFDNQIRGKVDISPFFDMAMSTCFQTFFEIEINSSGFISKIMTQRHHEYARRNSSKLVIRLPCFGNSKCRPYGIRTCVMRLFLIHEGDFAI